MPTYLTRIKNNQITDSTILANTKIVPGSIVGSLFNANLTMTSDVTITGNLTVQGSSTYLTVASTNTYVNDPLIVMNNAFTGTNTYDIGLLFNRGNQTNQALIWNEAADEFRFIATNETGTTYGNVAEISWATVHVGNITVEGSLSTSSFTAGTLTGTNLSLVGDLAVNGGDFTSNSSTFNLLTSNVTTLSAFTSATTANIGAASGTLTLNYPTVVGSQPTQDLYNTGTATMNFAGAATAVNIGGSTGVLSLNNANIWMPNATTVGGAQSTVAIFNIPATVDAFKGATDLELGATSGTLTLNNPTVIGSQTTQNLYNTLATTMNFAGAATSLNLGAATGTLSLNNANIYLPNATTIFTGQSTVSFASATTSLTLAATTGTTTIRNNLDVDLSLNARDINNTVIGNVTPASGKFTNVYDTALTEGRVIFVGSGNALTDSAQLRFDSGTWELNVGPVTIYGGGNEISTTSGDLTINPSGNNIIAANNVIRWMADPVESQDAVTLSYLNTAISSSVTNLLSDNTDITVTDDGISAGAITANIDGSTFFSADSSAAAFYGTTSASTLYIDDANGNVAVNADLYVGNDLTVANGGSVAFLDASASTDTTTGALVVTGGVGIGGNLNVGGNTVVNGPVTLTNSSDATSSTSGGALTVAGGLAVQKKAYFGGNVTIEGNLVVLGNTTTVGTNNLTINDSIINLHYDNDGVLTTDDGRDVGIRFHFYKGTNDNAFLGWANDTGYLEWYGSGVTESNAATITGEYGSFKLGNILLVSNVASTSTTTGALVINDSAGIGLGGNIWMGGPVLGTNSSTFNVINTNATTVNAFGAATALNVGATSGTLTLSNPTVVGSQTTQSLYNTVATTMNFAGAATALNMGAATGTATVNNATFNVAGNANVQQTTDSTSPVTGALRVMGGVGIGANLFVGGQYLGTDETTFNLVNSTATTVNFAGAATALTLGATSGTATVQNANIWVPNATTLDGSQATVGVFNNATTVDAFKGATDLEFGATTGTLTVNNPTVVGTQGTQNLYNTTATTMNFAGAATTLNMGAASGTATINNATVNLQGNVNVNQVTPSTSTTSGALVVDGGVGVAGNVYADKVFANDLTGTLQTAAQPNITSVGNLTTLTVSGNISAERLFSTSTALQAPTAGNYAGERLRLYDFANVAKTNYAIGAEGSHVWMGVDSTLEAQGFKWYGDTTQVMRLSAAGNLYLWGSTTVTTNVTVGGSLVVDTAADINELSVTASTVSTSPTTGALKVTGGAGFDSNVNIANGAVVNYDQTLESFQVKGKYATTLIYADSVTDTVTIGGSNTTPVSGATLRVNGNGAMIVPVGTTGQRPGSSGNVDVAGMVRFNTSTNTLEFYTGTAWEGTQGDFTVIAIDSFTGNGVQTTFNLGGDSTTAGALVAINGVMQIPTTSYSITGNTLVFTEAPAQGDEIDIRRITTSKTITEVGYIYNNFIANVTHSYITTGSVSATPRILVDTSGKTTFANDVELKADTVNNQDVTNIPLSSTAYLVDSFATGTYTSAKYLAQVKDGATNAAHTFELLLVHDTSAANLVTVSSVNTGSSLGTFTANVQSGSVKLWYSSTSVNNSNVRVAATYIK